MSYNELRDKMASEYCGYETEPIQCFKAGWDAARANFLPLTAGELEQLKLVFNQMGGLPETAISSLLKYADDAAKAYANAEKREANLRAEVERLEENQDILKRDKNELKSKINTYHELYDEILEKFTKAKDALEWYVSFYDQDTHTMGRQTLEELEEK